jgi:hypothetical protein
MSKQSHPQYSYKLIASHRLVTEQSRLALEAVQFSKTSQSSIATSVAIADTVELNENA